MSWLLGLGIGLWLGASVGVILGLLMSRDVAEPTVEDVDRAEARAVRTYINARSRVQ